MAEITEQLIHDRLVILRRTEALLLQQKEVVMAQLAEVQGKIDETTFWLGVVKAESVIREQQAEEEGSGGGAL